MFYYIVILYTFILLPMYIYIYIYILEGGGLHQKFQYPES